MTLIHLQLSVLNPVSVGTGLNKLNQANRVEEFPNMSVH